LILRERALSKAGSEHYSLIATQLFTADSTHFHNIFVGMEDIAAGEIEQQEPDEKNLRKQGKKMRIQKWSVYGRF